MVKKHSWKNVLEQTVWFGLTAAVSAAMVIITFVASPTIYQFTSPSFASLSNAALTNSGFQGTYTGDSTFNGQFIINDADAANGTVIWEVQDNNVAKIEAENRTSGMGLWINNSSGTRRLQLKAETNLAAVVTNTGINLNLAPASGTEVDVQAVLQYDTSTLTIASGTAAATRSYHVLNGESASADTLTSLTGGEAGDIVWLERGDADITIDCVSPAGNMSCPGAAADIVLADEQVAMFINNGTSWIAPRENN